MKKILILSSVLLLFLVASALTGTAMASVAGGVNSDIVVCLSGGDCPDALVFDIGSADIYKPGILPVILGYKKGYEPILIGCSGKNHRHHVYSLIREPRLIQRE